ncbi:MAG: hypothetical protein R3F48_01070 [Candidatus Zixiibacteriota bacterium]
MIVITLDSQVLSKIAGDEYLFNQIYEKAEKLYKSQCLVFLFSPIVFIESMKGVKSEKHFIIDQNRVRKASILCNKHFLPDTSNHLRNTIKLNSEKDAYLIGNNWNRRFYEIATCDSFEVYQAKHMPTFIRLNRQIEENHKAIKTILTQVQSGLKGEEYKNEEFMNSLRLDFLNIAIDHFDIKNAITLTMYSLTEIERKLPGLTFFAFSYAKLVQDYFDPDGRKDLLASDYCDMLQTIYLDTCDYIVSEDRYFAGIVNNSGLKELEGRVITFAEFTRFLDNLPLEKKAPYNPDFIQIPPQN